MRSARLDDLHGRGDLLIAGFPRFLDHFHRRSVSRKPLQLNLHRETIALRLSAGSIHSALDSPAFVSTLYATLRAWGVGSRHSRLVPLPEFETVLQRREADFAALEGLAIDDVRLPEGPTSERIWRLVSTLNIAENESRIVAGTHVLHYLLPDLVVPVGRDYTRCAMGWRAWEFRRKQSECFARLFNEFARIARGVNPRQYVGQGWNTSCAKVIDNALVGAFVTAVERRAAMNATV